MNAVDLRGHGDSEWSVGSQYSRPEFVLDVANLGRELDRNPLTVIGHSLGGAVALEYAGVFPGHVEKVVAIEGLGPAITSYYRRSVITPDGFVETARGFTDFARAIRDKIRREVSRVTG